MYIYNILYFCLHKNTTNLLIIVYLPSYKRSVCVYVCVCGIGRDIFDLQLNNNNNQLICILYIPCSIVSSVGLARYLHTLTGAKDK